MKDDWRLFDQMTYLYQKDLKYIRFQESEMNDHEHCSFCWAKFSEDSEDLHYGYVAMYNDDDYWICETCYQDFKEMFEWKLVKKDNE